MRLLNPVALLGRTPKARKLIGLALVAVVAAVVLQMLVKTISPPPPQSQSFAPLTTIPDQAEVVETGFFLMNMYDLDTASNTYYADFYAWFKWQGELDPLAQLELANGVEDWGLVLTPTYDEPETLPDGRFYQVWRVEGRFVQPFSLERYPLDSHNLSIQLENSAYTTRDLVYVADRDQSGYAPTLAIPGWRVLGSEVTSLVRPYTTNFGDGRLGTNAEHSVLEYSLHIARPPSFFFWKLLLPLIIVVGSSWGALMLNPHHTDSRIALPVTALLTAVFLQDAYSSTLPDIGYLVLMDKIYVIAYILIFVSIVEAIVTADWIKDDQPEMYSRVIQIDRLLLALQIIAILVGALVLILMS